MSMFSSSVAYEDFLKGVAPAFEEAGFKRVKVGFRKRTKFAHLEVKLSKSAETRADKLVCGLGVGADLKALDPFFRPKNRRDGIPIFQFYDSFVPFRELVQPHVGHWIITSDVELGEAVADALRSVPGICAFSDSFESDGDVLSRLREYFLLRDVSMTAGQLKYPAYLAATGRIEEFEQAIEELLSRFAGDEGATAAVRKGRQAIARIAGVGGR